MKVIKHKLGELLRVTRGASLPGTGYADSGKYLRLTLANFQEEGGFKEFKSTQGKFFVESFDSRFLMRRGDLITPLTEQSPGLLGSVAFVPCDGLYIQSQDVGLISCNTEMLDKRFAYYLFLTHSVREQISARSQQTKIRHTSPDKIADVEVYLPDLPTQLRIAGVIRKCISVTGHSHYLSTNSNLERCLSISLSSFAPCALRSARRDLNPAIFSANSSAVIGTYSILTSKY